jgi:23S rRNA (uracil1939-C5)-methyltransferase
MARNRRKNLPIVKLKAEKFVSGGQVLAHDEDGRVVFIWRMLPGEEALVQLTKRKKDWSEGVATEVLTKSPERVDPKDEEYLSTSPWQILKESKEDEAKLNILQEQFSREVIEAHAEASDKTSKFFNYRNKMEYCFWADDDGLSLSLRKRGTNQKIAVSGSSLAQESINNFGLSLTKALNQVKAEGRQLKSVIIRCSASGAVSSALFIKDENFQASELITKLKAEMGDQQWGIEIYFSNPRSPASVPTKLIETYGSTVLQDQIKLSDKVFNFEYSPLSFFQGNISAYQQTLSLIKKHVYSALPIVDMFSGVGSIGLSLADPAQHLSLVELDEFNTKFAKLNSADRDEKLTEILTCSSETALESIISDINLIVDPPRAGLHKDLTEAIIDKKPKVLVYLSCNPATQARDVKLLTSAGYKIQTGPIMFNFFPRTPHIESLVIMLA